MEFRIASRDEATEWEAFAAAHPEGRLYHSVAYFDTLSEWSHDHELLVARQGGDLIAGAVIHSRAVPGLGWRSANIEGGILMKENTPEILEALYPSLIRHLDANSYVALRLHMRTPHKIEGSVGQSSLPLAGGLKRF